MTKDELIAKQQIQIEEYKEKFAHNTEVLRTLGFRFSGIGQPLNDNLLQMNRDQLNWVKQIETLVANIGC